MKLKFLIALLITFQTGWSQSISGTVIDSKSKAGLAFVNITINGGHFGTSTDIDGKFTLPEYVGEINYIGLSYVGYEKKEITSVVDGMQISLTEITAQLNEIILMPGENPAHRIIRNTVKFRDENNPNNIPAFSYQTYSKFFITLNTDSVNPEIEERKIEEADSSYTEKDSSNFQMVNFIKKQHLFFMESVTERSFLAPYRDNETVIASRTSGFKSPMFSLISSQMQSFSFYENYITIMGKEYLNPITPGSDSRYNFILEDTLFSTQVDSIFIISFRPKPNYGFQPMKGVLYIHSGDWAIQNVISQPFESDDIQIKIEQEYKKFGEHTWFPIQLNAELNFPSLAMGDIIPYGRIRTSLNNIEINPIFEAKDISSAEITILDNAVEQAELILPKFRIDTLSNQESTTYQFIDSLSKAENIEAKMLIINSLARGYIPWGPFNFGLDKTLRYNFYEGLRLGGNIYTNDKVSKWFKIGGYFGYGFGDERLKHGWDTEISISKRNNFRLKGGYQFEIFESGGTEFLQRKNTGISVNVYRSMKIIQWDEVSRYYAGFTYDIMPKTHLEVKMQRENRFTVGDYAYLHDAGESAVLRNGFNYSEFISSIRYAPNEKFIEGAGFGKFAYELKYPIFHFQYTQGVKDLWLSDFNYQKIDVLYENQFPTLWLGSFTLIAQAGFVSSALPYSKLYTNMSNMTNADAASKRYAAIADRHSFETMRINEFLSDTYFQFLFRQDLKSMLFRRKSFAPHLEIVTRMAWGTLRNPQSHFNLPAKSLEKGFYESGLEFNNLLSNKIGSVKASIGIGSYYRYGPYSLNGFENNFALKLTSKLIF